MSSPHMQALVLIAPCALLLGSLLQIAVARLGSARTKGILAVMSCLPALLAMARLVPLIRNGSAVDFTLLHWDGPFSLTFHVDALSILFALMGSGLGAIVLLYSVAYMERDRAATRFYLTMLVFIGGFIALVCSADLLFLYLCWEVIGLCSFSLVGFWYADREALRGARKVLLMTHIAGYGLLAAILILYHRTGSTLWTNPSVARHFTGGIFLLMLAALVAKSVQVPLHTWIPEAMAAPTPVSSLLHAACYVTAGVYLAARMHSFREWPAAWGAALMWIGAVTMVVGVMYAMVQTDLKRMLAFSTVSQIGYMMMGLGIGTSLAITAGLLHCLNHGFFKGGLFLNAGAVQHAAGTRDMNQLGGLAQRMPRTTLAWFIGAGNMAGIPLMSGFVSKWMLYTAAIQAGWAIPALVAWVVSLGTVFLCAKATSAVFLGSLTEKTEAAHETSLPMQWGMGLMAAGSVVLGIAPQLAVNYLLNPVLAAFSLGPGLQVTWLGLFSGAGSFSTTGGLVLALVSLVLGGAIYAFALVSRPAAVVAVAGGGAVLAGVPGGVFTGGEPLADQERLTAHDFSRIFEQIWEPFFRWSNVDRIYLAIWRLLQGISGALATVVARLEQRAIAWMVLLSAILLAGTRWFSPSRAFVAPSAPPRVPQLMIVACAIAAVGLLLAAAVSEAGRRLAPWMMVSSVAGLAGLAQSAPWLRFGFLECSALMTVPLVFQRPTTRPARQLYVAMLVLSIGSLGTAEFLMEHGEGNWSRALLITGACVKLAAVPCLFWLLRLADELPALVVGQIIAVVDIAAFGEFYSVAQASPLLLTPQSLWLTVAAGTSLIAALLMLAQRDLKRLLVVSTIEDIGFLFLGLAAARAAGFNGALIAAATHALAKALLFGCLSWPESNDSLQPGQTGLAGRYPVSAFGFLLGMLAMLGVPPTLGFIGRWSLYESALTISPWLLAGFVLSSALALMAYATAGARIWWGPAGTHDPASEDRSAANKEPLLLQIAIVALVVVLLVPGMWPGAMQLLNGGGL